MAYIDTDTDWSLDAEAPHLWERLVESHPYEKYNGYDAWRNATKDARNNFRAQVIRQQVQQLLPASKKTITDLMKIETGNFSEDIKGIMRDARMAIIAAKQAKNPAAIEYRISEAKKHIESWSLA